MMNWELIKDCIDIKKPYQSRGNKGGEGSKAIYYLKLPEDKKINLIKYDADCVRDKFGNKDGQRIGDSFFRIICDEVNSKNKQIEKLILVETKGKQEDYFEQLSSSFDLFKENGFDGSIHGRFVGYNVPSAVNFKKKYGTRLDSIQRKFKLKNGTVRFGNRGMWEEIKNCKESDLRTQDEKSEAEKVKL